MSRLDDIRNEAKTQLDKAGNDPTSASGSGALILPGPVPQGIVKEEYTAFGESTDSPEMRVLIYARRFFMMPQYLHLHDVFFDGQGEYLGLIFEHQTVSVHGQNLLPIVTAMRTHRVQWLKEFDPLIHLDVTAPGAPRIAEIEIATKGQTPISGVPVHG